MRHPLIPTVQFAKLLMRHMPLPLLKMILWLYTIYARAREGDSPEVREALCKFVQRRTKEDDLAFEHVDFDRHRIESSTRSIALSGRKRSVM